MFINIMELNSVIFVQEASTQKSNIGIIYNNQKATTYIQVVFAVCAISLATSFTCFGDICNFRSNRDITIILVGHLERLRCGPTAARGGAAWRGTAGRRRPRRREAAEGRQERASWLRWWRPDDFARGEPRGGEELEMSLLCMLL